MRILSSTALALCLCSPALPALAFGGHSPSGHAGPGVGPSGRGMSAVTAQHTTAPAPAPVVAPHVPAPAPVVAPHMPAPPATVALGLPGMPASLAPYASQVHSLMSAFAATLGRLHSGAAQ